MLYDFLTEYQELRGLCFTGKLIPRHQSIFKSNQFFRGISIPEPEDMVNCSVLDDLFVLCL